jgi:hypothetical protein
MDDNTHDIILKDTPFAISGAINGDDSTITKSVLFYKIQKFLKKNTGNRVKFDYWQGFRN